MELLEASASEPAAGPAGADLAANARVEIERKFLIKSPSWREAIVEEDYLRDGLVGEFDGCKLRVRIARAWASLTLKGPRQGIRRQEFEYEIPIADAEAIMASRCAGRILEKRRFCVPHEGFDWSVDVYTKDLDGIELAELELRQEDQQFPLPPWAGTEVTLDPRFQKKTMFALSRASTRRLSIADLLALAV